MMSFLFQHRFQSVQSYREKKSRSLKEQTQSESLVLRDIKQSGGTCEENKSCGLHPLSETPVHLK